MAQKTLGMIETRGLTTAIKAAKIHFIEVAIPHENLPEGKLSCDVEEKHITLKYKPTEEDIKTYLPLVGKEVKIAIIGYANDGYTEGYEVEILTPNIPYMGQEKVHITLSYAPEKGAKPVDTGKLNFAPCERKEIKGFINFRIKNN